MATIKLPQVGKSAGPATVRRWKKKVGDAVAQGDSVVEVETEEGLAEIQSPVAGKLGQRLVAEGQTVAVGAGIAVIGDEVVAESVRAVTESKAMSSSKEGSGSSLRSEPGVRGKVVPILMPKAGQSMEEGTLVKWHVKAGDSIKKGQVIFEIETDKANMEVEAADEGRLAKVVLAEGGTIAVMQPVAYIAESEADVEAFVAGQGDAVRSTGFSLPSEEQAKACTPNEGAQHSPAAPADGRVKASPAARKIAADRGVDLASLPVGSGPGGRILSTDVPAVPASFPAVSQPAQAMPAVPANAGEAVRKRMSPMRKAIAKNLSISKQTIPHFYIKTTINADPLMSFYQGEKAKYPCSLNDVVIMACAKAVMTFPPFRSQIDGEQIVEFPSANIGMAVGMDEGLVVPVLVGAEKLTLQQIGGETKRLAMNAKGGKIEGMGKGIFTISNMGMFGVEEFSAIINPPEAAILAVGTVREEVIVSGGTLKAGRVMTMTLSVDHRVIDGAMAAKFVAKLKEILEWPGQLIG